MFIVINGDALKELRKLKTNSVDCVCADTPSGTGFMNQKWDKDKGGKEQWIQWLTMIMREVRRVLKPGGHILMWALPRTSHWTAEAVERAGFTVRDVITHLFSTGFPANHNIRDAVKRILKREGLDSGVETCVPPDEFLEKLGTALKPSSEHWILARNVLEGTIAGNYLDWGTGVLNIDGCRVAHEDERDFLRNAKTIEWGKKSEYKADKGFNRSPLSGASDIKKEGRWPPNTILSHSPACSSSRCYDGCVVGALRDQGASPKFFPTFLYKAKPSRREKDKGLDALALKRKKSFNAGGIQGKRDKKAAAALEKAEKKAKKTKKKAPKSAKSQGLSAAGRTLIREDGSKTLVSRFLSGFQANDHTTVKSVDLMRWLIKLINPEGGTVLDMFTGSGTTGCAAVFEGFDFIGIELDPSYCEIARKRMEWWEIESVQSLSKNEETDSEGQPVQIGLFGKDWVDD